MTIIKNEVETLSAGDRLIFSTNEDSVVWPSFSNDETRLDLESYDVAAYVYQKRCVEGLSKEEILSTTRLSASALEMFLKYFDIRHSSPEYHN